jgi:choline dehydrogenase-like flavoprotein
MPMFIVIGSGPSGIACAAALIEMGNTVTLIDGGIALDRERDVRKRRMAGQDPQQWSLEDVAASRTPVAADGTVSSKLAYGSDYPYAVPNVASPLTNKGAGAGRSFAVGGFSTVWGAALMPFRQADLVDWPVTAEQLASAQAAILKLIPFAARVDGLCEEFPLYGTPTDAPQPGPQIENLLARMQSREDALAKAGIRYGASRVAVDFKGKATGRGCNQCGLCMHGCPRDLIYSAAAGLTELLGTGKLTYVSGLVVRRIEETGDSVTVHGVDASGIPQPIQGRRVFLAAGVFSSSEILLRSMHDYGRKLTISDAQYYVFPILQAKAVSGIVRRPLNTLAQAFLEILDDDVSPYAVQIQIYGYNDLLREILKRKLGALYSFFPENLLLGRFLLAQGYLHSNHSGHIELSLAKEGEGDRVYVTAVTHPETRMRIDKVLKKLTRAGPAIGGVPLKPLLQVTEPGRGFHVGGSFPMRASPRAGESDTLGRPFGMLRTHVVDASVLPSIPATTITQTVMANAYRIGRSAVAAEGG